MRVPVAENATLGELIERLDLPADREAILVNGTYVKPQYRIKDGDHIKVIRFISGG